MKIALLLVALFAFSSELFAYDFDSLETTYSKEVYDKRWYSDFMSAFEKSLIEKMEDPDDYEDEVLIHLNNISEDMESWNSEAVKDYLSDLEIWWKEANEILNLLPKPTLAIDANFVENLWKIDVEQLIIDYLSWELKEKDKKYESSLKEISDLIDEADELSKTIKGIKGEIKGIKGEIKINDDKIKKYREIQKKINWIKNAMSWIKK